ncbi:MAG TPA: helix-turn-helix domain-containing protein [Blastocatellia bacterium]|nr:helix-turn-helix domain-containing protein [Blastocatellia bacterium]
MAEYLTTKQAATRLNVSHRWVQKLIEKGLLEAEGEVRARRVSVEACDSYARGGIRGTLPPEPEEPEFRFDEGEQLTELYYHLTETMKRLDAKRIPAGLREEILDAGARFAQLLGKARMLQGEKKFYL